MDALSFVTVAMAFIIALWLGYLLGNFFPVFGKAKQYQLERKALDLPTIDINPAKEFFQKALGWLLEREEKSPEDDEDYRPHLQSPESITKVDVRKQTGIYDRKKTSDLDEISDDAIILWYDRRKKKLIVKIQGDLVDLKNELTDDQHGPLSMLLVDLQERIGLAALLKTTIVTETDRVFDEMGKGQGKASSKDDVIEKPSFNPLKSIVNYVTSDIPKLDEKTISIPEQINAILQKNIKGSHLEKYGISMSEWPNRGIVFIVGVSVFNEIDEIPEPDIRDAIRKSVKEWEDSQDED